MGEQETGFVRAREDSEPFSLMPGWKGLVRAQGAETGGTLGAVEETVAPGDGPPVHVHRRGDELFYVLEGSFTFLIAGRRRAGGVGTVAFVPHGTAHTWQNTGGVPGRMLFVFTPAGFERALADFARTPDATQNEAAMVALSAQGETDYIGPRLADLPS